MIDLNAYHEQAPAHILAGALAHLAQHMENGCLRSAYLAAMLLEQIAVDPRVDAHLRQHAQQLVEVLERSRLAHDIAPGSQPPRGRRQAMAWRSVQ